MPLWSISDFARYARRHKEMKWHVALPLDTHAYTWQSSVHTLVAIMKHNHHDSVLHRLTNHRLFDIEVMNIIMMYDPPYVEVVESEVDDNDDSDYEEIDQIYAKCMNCSKVSNCIEFQGYKIYCSKCWRFH
jgi:hypothetical protein